MNINNSRWVVKGSSVPGIIPTLPATASVSSLTDHTLGGWTTTDIYDRELFANTSDKKLWVRLGGEIIYLGGGGSFSSFINLSDVPQSYTASSLKSVRVKSDETGLEFYSPTEVTSVFQLTEFSGIDGFTGSEGYSLIVAPGATAIGLTSVNQKFVDLTDVDMTGYTASNVIIVNSGGTGIDQVDINTIALDLSTDQSVTGNKTFATASFTSIVLSDLYFTGTTENTQITDLITSMTYSSDNALATSLAVKNYVVESIAEAAGVTFSGNLVTTDTVQIITGRKSFSGTHSISGLSVAYVDVKNEVGFGGGTKVFFDPTTEVYFGDETTDGSWKMYINPNGNLSVEKNISGTWSIGEEFEHIYSEQYIVGTSSLLTIYDTPISAGTISITTDQYVLPIECEVYFSGGTTNYSESSSDYPFSVLLVSEDTITTDEISGIISLYSGKRSISTYSEYKNNRVSGNNYYTIVVSTTSFSGNPDAGDRNMIINLKYKIKTIPSF